MRLVAPLILIIFLLTQVAGQTAGLAPLWRVGDSDNKADELALGPDGKSGFLARFGGGEGVFYLGQNKERDSFPYALPGPGDDWGGASRWSGPRLNSARIGFVLESSTPAESCVLVVDLLDTHPSSPPVLRIEVNGSPHDFRLPPGGSANSLHQATGSSREHVLHFPIPPKEIRTGYNEIALSVVAGSWLVFDSLRFDAPGGVVMAPARDTIVRSVTAAPYSMQSIDTAGPILLLDVVQFNRPTTLFLEVEKSPMLRRVVAPGRTVIEAPAPIAATGEGRITAGGSIVYNGIIERRDTHPVEASDYVDQLIGTGRARPWQSPGPWMPAALAKPAPDTPGHHGSAGYDYNQTVIHGFSHLHGVMLAGLRVVPQTGVLRTTPGDPAKPGSGYSSRFSRQSEKAEVGRYSVRLEDAGVLSELTATTRAVLHRHTFDNAANARLLLDFSFDAETPFTVEKALVRRVSETEIEGFVEQRSRDLDHPGEQFYRINFAAQLSQPLASLGGWNQDAVFEDQEEVQFRGDVGAILNLGPVSPENPVLMRMGLSFVSIANARLNLETELSKPFGWDFAKVAAHQKRAWNQILRAVELGGDDRREKVRFYTNFYRALAGRTTFSDVNGDWMGPGEKNHSLSASGEEVSLVGGGSHFGAQWSLNPLFNLLVPSQSVNRVRTELALREKTGWISSGAPVLEHLGTGHPLHSLPLLASAKLAGLKGLDSGAISQACQLDHLARPPGPALTKGTVGHPDLVTFRRHRFAPADQASPSSTLELAYLMWCAAQACQPGDGSPLPVHAQESLLLSGYWKNVFDPSVLSTRPKLANGAWVSPFDRIYTKGYLDSNAAQFTWFVPHDVPGLIKLFTAEKFVQTLRQDLEKSSLNRFAAPGDQPSLSPLAHSNRVTLQAPWLFNWAGQPALTQRWTREILDRFYGYGPNDGLHGEDHEGQLGAWFVLTSLGLFQTDGGCRQKPVWELTAPRHASATLHLDPRHYPGGTFNIEVRNFNPNHHYIQKAWLNGLPLSRWWITHAEIVQGGSLLFELGPKPNPDWAAFSNLPSP